MPTQVSLHIQDFVRGPPALAITVVYHNRELTSLSQCSPRLFLPSCFASQNTDPDCKSREGYQVPIRPSYHRVTDKARAQAHILIKTVQRSCWCRELAMSRMRALTAKFKSLRSLELMMAFPLNFNVLTPRMRAGTSALPTTQGSEPTTVFSPISRQLPDSAGRTRYRAKPTSPSRRRPPSARTHTRTHTH